MLKVTVIDKKNAENCPYRDVINRIGDKWSLLVLAVLEPEPKRFNELKRIIGDISQKVLTKTLRNLEADGYVKRIVYDTSPPKVVYQLSEIGLSVLVPINQIVQWAEAHHEAIKCNRVDYKKRTHEQSHT